MPSGDDTSERNQEPPNITPEHVYSVSELTQDIKQVLSSTPRFKDIVLQGEISDFKRAASGHIYFRLKDESSIIACAFLSYQQLDDCDDLEDGLQVRAQGYLTVYEPRGQYQLNITKVAPIGAGIFSQNLNRLREKLEGEGLFNQDRKKPIPRLPRKIGVVTSKNSASINDIWTVVNARFPKMNLVMAYVTLQGAGAPGSIIQAISRLSEIRDVDAIILARGGGPSDEFMVFNDEELVRTIASCTKPIITGLGHEKDVCLADLVADYRASTPSTAAREAVPDVQKLRNSLYSLGVSLDRSYNSYRTGLKLREKDVALGRKDEEIKEAMKAGESSVLKYNVAILALIVLLVLIILIFLLKG